MKQREVPIGEHYRISHRCTEYVRVDEKKYMIRYSGVVLPIQHRNLDMEVFIVPKVRIPLDRIIRHIK